MTPKKKLKTNEIARSAFNVFSRNGYALTSIEQVAREAGIGKSTVYEYFATKEELFIAAVMYGADNWITDLKAIGRETDDPVERLELIANYYVESLEDEQQGGTRVFLDVINQACLQGGVFHERPQLIRDLHQRIVRIMVDFLLEGISRGQLSPEIASQAEKICINLMAFLDGILMHGLIEKGYIDVREQIALFFKHMIPLLTGGPHTKL